MTGTWGTEELRLASDNGYEILEAYEVLHWPKEERSSTVMRGYVSFFLRMKQVRAAPLRPALLRHMTNAFYIGGRRMEEIGSVM